MREIAWSLSAASAPAGYLSVDAAKEHLRQQNISVEDHLIETYLRAAERTVAADLGIALVEQQFVLKLDRFPECNIKLPRPPLISVESIKYLDPTTEALVTLDPAAYVVVPSGFGLAESNPGFVRPVYRGYWPTPLDFPQAVEIAYTAGLYTGGATPEGPHPSNYSVPPAIRSAVLLVLAELHQQREVTLFGTISSQLPLYERLVGEHRCLWEPKYV